MAGSEGLTDVRLVVRPDRAVIEVTGKDRTSYLHRMLTQDVAGLRPMRAAYACVLSPTGRILGDPVVWNLGDRYLLDLSRAAARQAIPALERTVIADDVTFRDVCADVARFCMLDAGWPLPGAMAPGLVEPFPVTTVQVGTGSRKIEVQRLPFTDQGSAVAMRRDIGREPCIEVIAVPLLVETLRISVREVAPAELERIRVEEGVPAYGAELDERVLPNEANLESAISWTKGCYPGQEPVVMAKHRGHPPNRLVRLDFGGDVVPSRDEPLLEAGKPVGRVTSAVRGVRLPGIVGMGYVRHALAKEGAVFALGSGAKATVRALV